MAIKSDLTGASQKATTLKTATDRLKQQSSTTNDTRTTVAGNNNAHEVIDIAQKTTTKIAQAVFTAATNLQSVAQDFEVLDRTSANSLLKR